MIKILERSKGNVFGLEASGDISKEEILAVEARLDEAIKEYGKINWLYVIKSFEYASLGAMYADMMWLLKNIKQFDKMAVVGNKKWEEILVKADSLIFGEKYFDLSELDKAWEYVESK